MDEPKTAPGADDQTIARIEIDRELCIGAASCVAVAPDVFDLDQENKAVLKPGYKLDQEAILNAAKVCPVLAIYLYNKDGKKIYPQ